MNIYERYYLNDEIKDKLLREAIIVFDSSALLDLYFYSEEVRETILQNVFEKLGDRLWLPAQIKFEFLKNRKKVSEKPIYSYQILIKDTKKGDGNYIFKIRDSASKIESINLKYIKSQLKTLKEKTNKKEKHPFFDEKYYEDLDNYVNDFEQSLMFFESNIKQVYSKFEQLIKEKTETIERTIECDQILSVINKRFQVGDEYTYDRIIKIAEEGKFRYENKIPPGYMDEEDKIGFQVYGDLIAWKQVLEYGKKMKKPILLVSNDAKEDWIDPEIPETPRFELLKEFNSYVEKPFWIYKMSTFLYEVNNILDNKLKDNVIEEVKENENIKVSKKFSINEYGVSYEFECGIDNIKNQIFIENLKSNVKVDGKYITLEKGLYVVGTKNLHIQIPDKEFGCFNDAIYDNYDNPEWYLDISIDDLYSQVYEFLFRIIRFEHGDLNEDELFHVDQEWIDNPNT